MYTISFQVEESQVPYWVDLLSPSVKVTVESDSPSSLPLGLGLGTEGGRDGGEAPLSESPSERETERVRFEKHCHSHMNPCPCGYCVHLDKSTAEEPCKSCVFDDPSCWSRFKLAPKVEVPKEVVSYG